MVLPGTAGPVPPFEQVQGPPRNPKPNLAFLVQIVPRFRLLVLENCVSGPNCTDITGSCLTVWGYAGALALTHSMRLRQCTGTEVLYGATPVHWH
eukprot:3731364-Rhodomonas_salina.3